MVDITPYRDAADAASRKFSALISCPLDCFIEHLREQGYKPGKIQIGAVARFPDPSDKGQKNSAWAFYSEFADGKNDGQFIGVGVYGSWKKGDKNQWCSKEPSLMTFQERKDMEQSRIEARIKYEAAEKEKAKEAAEYARTIWENAKPAFLHPYLKRKGVECYGLKQGIDGALLIPVYINGGISSLQTITSDGVKSFLTGGKVRGGFYKIEGDTTALICEGYATGATLHEATGHTVYVAFNANNLYEVTQWVKANHVGRIIICGDDDHTKPENIGKKKAMTTAESFNCDVLLPKTEGSDFNDMAAEKGLPAIKELFKKNKVSVIVAESKIEEVELPPEGFLRDVYHYYNATSGVFQHGFSIQTALALASVICARRFKTNMENYSSLYLLNIGKSATGKEHGRKIIREVLSESNSSFLLAGEGYSSGSAVMSALLRKPRHASIIDEFGIHLEALKLSKDTKYVEANRVLMSVIGACDSSVEPHNMSTLTLSKKDADLVSDRIIIRPAITIYAMSTPSTFFESINEKAVKNGFLGRFIISISDVERQPRKPKEFFPPPRTIVSWIERVHERCRYNTDPDIPSELPPQERLFIAEDALSIYSEFDYYCIQRANDLDDKGIDAITGRAAEMSLRVGLICALSRDPNTFVVTKEDMRWAVHYVKTCMERTIDVMMQEMHASPFEKSKQKVMQAFTAAGHAGITKTQMCTMQPFSLYKPKERDEILEALIDGDLIGESLEAVDGSRRPIRKYYAKDSM